MRHKNDALLTVYIQNLCRHYESLETATSCISPALIDGSHILKRQSKRRHRPKLRCNAAKDVILPKELQETFATIVQITPKQIVASCPAGYNYYLSWNGKGIEKEWKEGDVVLVHYKPGFEREAVSFIKPTGTPVKAPTINEGV